MAKKAKAAHATTIQTRDELESVLGQYARSVITRGKLVLAMDEKINAIRRDYETRLADLDAEQETLFADMEAWAALHPAEFAAQRSIDLVHGKLGFRTGNPTLKCIKGCKWEHVLDMLRCHGSTQRYIRTVEEPNKDLLLADREKIGADRLRTLGMQVDQVDRFYVEPKLEAGAV
jgi:phage host-nuclease inhibitor protein Gam